MSSTHYQWPCTPIIKLSCLNWTIYPSVHNWQITQTAIAWTPDPNKKKMLHKFTHYYTFMLIYGSKLQNFWTFWDVKNWYLMDQQTANQWHTQKSKTWHVEHPTIHLWIDSWSISQCQVPFKQSGMCQKMQLFFWQPVAPPEVCHPPPPNGDIA